MFCWVTLCPSIHADATCHAPPTQNAVADQVDPSLQRPSACDEACKASTWPPNFPDPNQIEHQWDVPFKVVADRVADLILIFCLMYMTTLGSAHLHPQPGHVQAKGFSPVCLLRWALRWLLLVYILLQPGKEHLCILIRSATALFWYL